MSQYTNPIFQLLPEQISDESIAQYEYVQYNTTDGLEITNFGGPTYKIITKDLNSYLLPQKGYLELVYRITDATGATLANKSTKMHDSVLALFRKCSYFMNSVAIDEVEYPVLPIQIKNLLDYSDDYVTKQGPMYGMYYEDGDGAFDADDERVDILSDGANSKRVRVIIPLNRIFGFLDAYNSAMRGIEHRFEFVKETTVGYFAFGDGSNATKVVFDEMSIWMPKLVPSFDAETKYLDTLKSGDSTLVPYESWNGYRQSNTGATAQNPTTNLVWQISATSKKPKYVFVNFQLASRLDTVSSALTLANPSLYDNLNITKIELRVNSKRYPDEAYDLRFGAPTNAVSSKYIRAFKDFLKVGDKEDEYDNGSLVSYDDYRTKYAIFAFDLSHDHSLFENVQTNYISVDVDFAPGVTEKFYSNAVIVWDKELKMGGKDQQLSILRD